MSLAAELIRLGARLFIRTPEGGGVSIAQRRTSMDAYSRRVPPPPAGTMIVQKALGCIPAERLARPLSNPDRVVFFLHGGGYVSGGPGLYRQVTWRIAEAARAAVISVDYRLAPEHPFPAALDDAIAAWRALLDEGFDPRRCAILGDSAGGGLALSLVLKLRDEGHPLPAVVAAISPWTDLAITGPSALAGAADPMLTASELGPLAAHYLAGADPRDPYASPLYGDLHGLPPTLIQVGGDEILRDDATRMAQELEKAGCAVTLEIWPRMPHVWHAFAPILPEARRAITRIGEFVRQLT
ncbi:MAG TPA: alpha/beta hydrolase [Caulobacteraceae bacterium]|jgi:acetyl esterase/lipase|nr:alpha/beta hydrolase [Caulobacteraceae bacterium]